MIVIDGNHLSLDHVARVARQNEPVSLSPEAVERTAQCHGWVDSILTARQPVYGVNTGFGIFANRQIPLADLKTLNRHLILSHAVGTGPALPAEVVRAAMLIRANTLAKGLSGVRVQLIETLLAMLNAGVTPVVPSQGSLGSSGDLCQLAHLALVFTTDEKDLDDESASAQFDGKIISGKTAMQAAGLERIILGPKEGLAVTNGATFSAAAAALAVYDAQYLLDASEYGLALSLEAVLATSAAYDPRIHAARGQLGQIQVAQNVRRLIEGSTLIDSAGRVQDAYSLRCAPQVQGPARETLDFVTGIVTAELNAATDNPLIFGESEALSGGNFHGAPIGMAMDYLSIAMAEVGAIAERRIFRMTDCKLNIGLPPMLVDSPEAAGLNSGLMMPQYTAASLVLENQTLATPDSVKSLPTSAEQEDHNANAMTAARHARQIVENTARIIAIEIYTAARAIDLRLRAVPGAKLGRGTAILYRQVRERVAYQPGDAWWGPEIDQVHQMIRDRELTVNM
ncbi:MAG TPA: histidine ammonia-lyase [Anaerolineaceae bacterium]|nr:histidine ammonia-lyase [Anaerolineaceae bacterium]